MEFKKRRKLRPTSLIREQSEARTDEALTYKKHGGFLQVKILIQKFHALSTQPSLGSD